MRYDDPTVREALAASYALGTLRGKARVRYEALLKGRRDWEVSVDWWEAHIHLLAETVPPVTAPKQVWQIIESRLYGVKPASSLAWWRRLAVISSTAAIALALMLTNTLLQKPEAPQTILAASQTVAVLSDPQAKSAWLLALKAAQDGSTEIKATALPGAENRPDNSFELWLLPPDKSSPVSLGVLPQSGQTNAKVNVAFARLQPGNGLAVTLEPKGGSSTGKPTGPVVYQGKVTEL